MHAFGQDQERVILQALKLFTQLAEQPAVLEVLIKDDARKELQAIFNRFQEKTFGKYELEIRTELMLCERVIAKLSSDK